jgi:hypothetical protein
MAMVLLGRLSGWAHGVVLHLVPSEARACRQVLLVVTQADLVAWLVQTVQLGADCVAAGLNAAAAAVGVMVSA